MADSSLTYQLVSIPDAARILALSESTVRRLVKGGRLESEQVQRPQGHVWLVKVPAPSNDQVEQPPDQIAASGATYPDQPPASNPAEAMTGLVQATVATVLGPLVAELAAARQTNERQVDQLMGQADRIARQAETIGRVTVERDAAQAQIVSILEAQSAPASLEPAVPVWWRWWPAAVALVALLLAGVSLVWSR